MGLEEMKLEVRVRRQVEVIRGQDRVGNQPGLVHSRLKEPIRDHNRNFYTENCLLMCMLSITCCRAYRREPPPQE